MDEIFKISINKDSKKQDVSLDNISLEAAESLKVFIDSLTSFCENYSDDEKAKVNFSIQKGSLQLANYMQRDSVIYNEFSQILYGINNNEFNEFSNIDNCSSKIKSIKQIQEKIISNGLDYSVYFTPNSGETINMSKSIKNKIRHKQAYVYNTELVFLKGMLYEVGGKTITNIHILENEIEYKIDTDRDVAYEFSKFLYKDIFLAALKTTSNNPNNEIQYNFVDKYLSEETYSFYKELYESIKTDDISQQCDIIYDFLLDNFEQEKFGENIKLLKLLNNKSSNRGLLRFLLLSSKNYLKIDQSFDKMYYSIAKTLKKA